VISFSIAQIILILHHFFPLGLSGWEVGSVVLGGEELENFHTEKDALKNFSTETNREKRAQNCPKTTKNVLIFSIFFKNALNLRNIEKNALENFTIEKNALKIAQSHEKRATIRHDSSSLPLSPPLRLPLTYFLSFFLFVPIEFIHFNGNRFTTHCTASALLHQTHTKRKKLETEKLSHIYEIFVYE
jgi:hypothetical protein